MTAKDHIWKVAQSVGFDDYELRPMLEAFAAALSQQPAVPVVSDEQIDALAAGNNYPGTVPGYRRFARAILALRPADHPDTLRCIKARNDLNAALHGEGALIDDLEHAIANACAKLRRPAVEPMTPEQMQAILTEAGYDDANAQARADFINGARYGERHHGITAKAEGGA